MMRDSTDLRPDPLVDSSVALDEEVIERARRALKTLNADDLAPALGL